MILESYLCLYVTNECFPFENDRKNANLFMSAFCGHYLSQSIMTQMIRRFFPFTIVIEIIISEINIYAIIENWPIVSCALH